MHPFSSVVSGVSEVSTKCGRNFTIFTQDVAAVTYFVPNVEYKSKKISIILFFFFPVLPKSTFDGFFLSLSTTFDMYSGFLRIRISPFKALTTLYDQVIHERTIDAFLLANLGSDLRNGKQIHQRNKGGEPAQNAAFAHSLRVLASGLAMAEIGCDACSAVIETTKQSMGPLLCHSRAENQRKSEVRTMKFRLL